MIPTRSHSEEAASDVELQSSTLAELGQTLPLGLLGPEGRERSFSFHPPKMGLRKKFGALSLRKDLKNHMGRYVSYYLATALKTLGGEPLPKDLDAAALKVARLAFPDVLYLLCYYQYVARPDGMNLGAGSCYQCGHEFGEVIADLGTLECTVLVGDEWSSQNRPCAVVGLREGMSFANKEIKTVAVTVPGWQSSMWGIRGESWNNTELRKAKLLKAAIVATDVADPPLSMEAIDDLWPDDERRIERAMGLVTPTIDLRVSIPCPNCEARNLEVIDPTGAGFFGSS